VGLSQRILKGTVASTNSPCLHLLVNSKDLVALHVDSRWQGRRFRGDSPKGGWRAEWSQSRSVFMYDDGLWLRPPR